MTPPDDAGTPPTAAQVAALARHLDRIARRLDALGTARDATDARVTGLRGDIDQLTARAEDAAARAERADTALAELDTHIRGLAMAVQKLAAPAAGGALCWLTQGPPGRPGDQAGDPPEQITASQAVAHLDDLAGWLARVYLRYPGAALPSCWAWHPAVVEELWWLRGAHADAYTGKAASWSKVGDWHERHRPGVVHRIAGWVGACDLARHADGGDRADRGGPAVPLAAHLPLVADTWSQARTVPAPDAATLADAERHDRAPAR